MPCRLPCFRIVKTQPIFRVPLSCSSFVIWWILRHGHSMWSKQISLHQVPMDLTSISWAAASWETWHLSGDSWRGFNSRLHVNCLAHLLCNPPSTSSVLPLSLSLLLSILFCTCAVQPLCDLYNVWTAYQLIFDTRSNQQRSQHIDIACSSPLKGPRTWNISNISKKRKTTQRTPRPQKPFCHGNATSESVCIQVYLWSPDHFSVEALAQSLHLLASQNIGPFLLMSVQVTHCASILK